MNETTPPQSSRREFLITSTRFAAASALAGLTLPHVHAAGSDLIQLALVGCGGRGTGAAEQALKTKGGPIKLVAMADVYADKLNRSYENLQGQAGGPPEKAGWRSTRARNARFDGTPSSDVRSSASASRRHDSTK